MSKLDYAESYELVFLIVSLAMLGCCYARASSNLIWNYVYDRTFHAGRFTLHCIAMQSKRRQL